MKQKYAIGLDYGTLSLRVLLIDCDNGKALASKTMMYPHGVLDRFLPNSECKLDGNWALQVPEDYLETMQYTIVEIMKQSKVMKQDIVGLSIDFTSCTVLPVDEKKVPLCEKEKYKDHPHAYAKLWKHHGAQPEADLINFKLEEMGILQQPRFGGKISPELLLPKALEILIHDSEVYDDMYAFMEAGDWLTWVLTDSRQRSGNMAAYKAMWTSEEDYPSPEILRTIHPKLERFVEDKLEGEICPAGSRIGRLNSIWAEKLGLPEGMAVGASIIDSHAGMPGSGIYKPGQMMLVLGTSSVQLLLSEYPYADHGVVGGIKGGIIPGYYSLEAGLAAVGDLFAWFVDNFVPSRYELEAKKQGKDIHQYLSEKASFKRPGETGLLALDWWNGNKTPYVNGDVSGLIIGMTLQTKPEDVYRALIEATAYGTRMIVEEFAKSGAKVEEIIVSGGITEKNAFLLQVFADVLNQSLKLSASELTAALGAAMYAGAAAGREAGGFDSIIEASRQIGKVKKEIYNPIPENVQIYEKLYREYCSLVNKFNPDEYDVMLKLKQLRR